MALKMSPPQTMVTVSTMNARIRSWRPGAACSTRSTLRSTTLPKAMAAPSASPAATDTAPGIRKAARQSNQSVREAAMVAATATPMLPKMPTIPMAWPRLTECRTIQAKATGW